MNCHSSNPHITFCSEELTHCPCANKTETAIAHLHLNVLVHAPQCVEALRMRLDIGHCAVSVSHVLPHQGLHENCKSIRQILS